MDADVHDGIDLPGNDDFDYEEFTRREFGSALKPPGIKTIWWITAIILLALSIALYVFNS